MMLMSAWPFFWSERACDGAMLMRGKYTKEYVPILLILISTPILYKIFLSPRHQHKFSSTVKMNYNDRLEHDNLIISGGYHERKSRYTNYQGLLHLFKQMLANSAHDLSLFH